MATTDFTITDADIGAMLDPADGFLISMVRTKPPVNNDGAPRWSASRLRWLSGYFVLRGTRDVRDLVSIDVATSGAFLDYDFGFSGRAAMSASLGYAGNLEVVCVPKGSEWVISLSDVPVARQLPPSATNFVGSNYVPHQPVAAPKV